MRHLKWMAAVAALTASATTASASFVAFVPPNDTIGNVFSTNNNDGYSVGRGIVFQMSANEVIDTVQIFQDLTGVTLNYKVSQVLTTSGQVNTGETVLRSGSGVFTTSGLQFVGFSFAPLTLQSGQNYHIEFSFAVNANQNFFYNNRNVPWTQTPFTSLEGTQAAHTSNFVVPAIRVNVAEAQAVPAPPAALLAVLGLASDRRVSAVRLSAPGVTTATAGDESAGPA